MKNFFKHALVFIILNIPVYLSISFCNCDIFFFKNWNYEYRLDAVMCFFLINIFVQIIYSLFKY